MNVKLHFFLTPLLVFLLVAFTPEAVQEDLLLFKIERSKDANTICYALNVNKEGSLAEEPITPFWIKYTKKGRIEPLTWIQKKYAYGLKYLSQSDDQATFQFVCYDKQTFVLKKVGDDFHVYTKNEDHILEVNRIFVQLDGGTFWFPKVPEIKLYAHDLNDDLDIVHSIKPQ